MDSPVDVAQHLTPARDIGRFQRTYATDEVVFRGGDRGSTMYVVLEGSVRIEHRDENQVTVIAERGPGEFFGEMALVDTGVRSASAIAAATPTRLVEIDKARFIYLVSQQPAFSLAVLRALCRRIPMPQRC